MNIFIRLKNDQANLSEKYKHINQCMSEFDDAYYSPFEEIITLIVTIIGVGGGSSIIVELIKKCSNTIS